jgi:hypothetical protein
LQGARVKITPESGGSELIRVARSLDEARALIEKSFGNYVGSEVMVDAKQQLARLYKDIEYLEKECARDDDVLDGRLTRGELQEYLASKEKSKVAFSSLVCNLLACFTRCKLSFLVLSDDCIVDRKQSD